MVKGLADAMAADADGVPVWCKIRLLSCTQDTIEFCQMLQVQHLVQCAPLVPYAYLAQLPYGNSFFQNSFRCYVVVVVVPFMVVVVGTVVPMLCQSVAESAEAKVVAVPWL